MSAYFVAAFTDSGCLQTCDHEHPTVTAAVACLSCAGGYVLAVEGTRTRRLTVAEETEFQRVMYGVMQAEAADVGESLGWTKVVLQR